jgi:hypothetical protein
VLAVTTVVALGACGSPDADHQQVVRCLEIHGRITPALAWTDVEQLEGLVTESVALDCERILDH